VTFGKGKPKVKLPSAFLIGSIIEVPKAKTVSRMYGKNDIPRPIGGALSA